MSGVKRMLMFSLLVMVVLCAGCMILPDAGDSLETTSGLESEESLRTESEETINSESDEPLEMWMLDPYADRFTWEKLADMCDPIDVALKDYAHDYGVAVDTLPAAQEYAAAYLEHNGSDVAPKSFRMLSAEYTVDYPKAIQDGCDLAIRFSYEDPMIQDVLIYVGETNCYIEVDGELEYVFCPATVKELTPENQVSTLEECMAIGKSVIEPLDGELGGTASLFSVLYPYISDQDFFPRFISARYDEGLSVKNQPGYLFDSGILYLTDADGNEYGFRMTIHGDEVTYNGTTILYCRVIH